MTWVDLYHLDLILVGFAAFVFLLVAWMTR